MFTQECQNLVNASLCAKKSLGISDNGYRGIRKA